MPMTATPLARFVNERFHELYDREPSSRGLAQYAGYAFSHQTAARIINGSHGAIDEATITGLADALKVTVGQIRSLAGTAPHNLGPFILPDRSQRLTRRERQTVLAVMDTILEAHQGKRWGAEDDTEQDEDGRPLRAVARSRSRTPRTRR